MSLAVFFAGWLSFTIVVIVSQTFILKRATNWLEAACIACICLAWPVTVPGMIAIAIGLVASRLASRLYAKKENEDF